MQIPRSFREFMKFQYRYVVFAETVPGGTNVSAMIVVYCVAERATIILLLTKVSIQGHQI